MSKIAVLEKELETKEVRMYKQAIRALKQIHVEDKEPKEKVKELTITMQKISEERNYWENLAKQLKGKESETAELVEARKEMIKILSDMCNGDMDIGIKRFGVIDSSPFHSACKLKFSHQVAEEKATELCSIWQTAVENPKWNPFKTITSNGEVRAEMIDQEDKHLQQLRKEWGYEVYLAVAIALKEIKEYNMKVKTTTHQLWNFKEGRKATLKEGICLMGKKLKEAKIKDTGFVKVDQLKPGTAGKNLIVKVLTTDVVVDKNQNNRWQSQSPCVYSQPQITRVAESLVGDETGTIIFTARNEQVDLMEPGSILLLYGAKVQMYTNHNRRTCGICCK
ncbi:factor of DNA methylation 1-like [Nicotiana tomentosiformis]|uniref:factor of DNA methylation 1-like n=1 Tax=Nicotiana tomentosiformis TaxID=4098 RepID=UPI00051AFADC|nr:factor of DNA methylation 1-like isoform X2 [Nicotiana tomentosiformis]